MYKLLYVAAALAGATATAAAQAPAANKVKVKSKPASRAARPAPAATADWSVPYAARITPAGLRADLAVLASDAYAGRATGQPGQQMAADYLAHAFAAAGLAGPVLGTGNPYFQTFDLNSADAAASMQIGAQTFVVNKDYYVLLRNPATLAAPLQPTFVGYGISTAGYADFAPAVPELKGKDLVMLLGEPLTKTGQPLLGQASAYGSPGFAEMSARSPAIYALAARTTIRISPSAAAFAQVPQAYDNLFDHHAQLTLPEAPPPAGAGPNVFIVSPAMGAALLGTTAAGLASYQEAVTQAGRPVASPFRPVAMQAVPQQQTITTENVLGYLEGTDKKNEVVVISAHYDHIGVQHGQVYNGADDDASGTASVLALARAFAQAKKDGHGPRRSLLFLANVAEEIGLLGSYYYTQHPVLPLATTVAALHIDMLGRVDSVHQGRGAYVYAIGDDWRSAELHTLSEATNRQYGPLALDYTYNNPTNPAHLYRRSDHYNFAKHGVPVIFYTSGLHADYHQPTDDVERIDFPALAQRSQLIFHTAWALANRDARPAPDATPKPVWP